MDNKNQIIEQQIDEMMNKMTIEELKAAAKVGIGVTIAMMNKTVNVIREHILKKGE